METVNPYQSPEGNLSETTGEFGEIKFFSPGCRIGRLRYLAHVGLVSLVFYALIGALFGLGSVLGSGDGEGGLFSGVLLLAIIPLYIALIAFIFVAMIQRLHDTNKSGWWLLLFFVPLLNIGIGLYVLFASGTPTENNFGNPPPPNKRWHWVVGLFIPVLSTVGIIAAVSLPAYQDYVERAAAQAQSN